MSNLLVELTPAEVNIIRQALRAERDRMVRQGFANLAKLAGETSNKISDSLIDSNRKAIYNGSTGAQGVSSKISG